MNTVKISTKGLSRDPRPLIGEPLPLDLLNTRWIDGDHDRDLLETVAGTAIWIGSADIVGERKPDLVGEEDQRLLRYTRDALSSVIAGGGDAVNADPLNAVLSHGHRQLTLSLDGPTSRVVVDQSEWMIPWLAAESYLDLLSKSPGRIRTCQHPRCVLWYLDTSRSGTRRWCSMTICGNRTKASRHYLSRTDPAPRRSPRADDAP